MKKGSIMKKIIIFSFIILINTTNTIPIQNQQDKEYDLDITGIWKDLDETSKINTYDFGGRWILAGTFIFRNKSGDQVKVQS